MLLLSLYTYVGDSDKESDVPYIHTRISLSLYMQAKMDPPDWCSRRRNSSSFSLSLHQNASTLARTKNTESREKKRSTLLQTRSSFSISTLLYSSSGSCEESLALFCSVPALLPFRAFLSPGKTRFQIFICWMECIDIQFSRVIPSMRNLRSFLAIAALIAFSVASSAALWAATTAARLKRILLWRASCSGDRRTPCLPSFSLRE